MEQKEGVYQEEKEEKGSEKKELDYGREKGIEERERTTRYQRRQMMRNKEMQKLVEKCIEE